MDKISVHLFAAIEKAFDVRLSDDEREGTATVGDTYAHLFEKLRAAGRLTDSAGEARGESTGEQMRGVVRERLAVLLGLTELPGGGAKLEVLLPLARRRPLWRRLGKGLGVRLPRLEVSGWWAFCFGFVGLLGAAVLFFSPPPLPEWFERELDDGAGALNVLRPIFWMLFWIVGTGFLDLTVGRWFRYRVPKRCSTASGLALWLLARGESVNGMTGVVRMREGELWEELQRVVAEHSYQKAEEITRDAHYVDDLGAWEMSSS